MKYRITIRFEFEAENVQDAVLAIDNDIILIDKSKGYAYCERDLEFGEATLDGNFKEIDFEVSKEVEEMDTNKTHIIARDRNGPLS